MKELNYLEAIQTTTDHLQHGGVFLTVAGKDGQAPNTMTIGWGGVCCIWGKPIFMAPVRPQRYTHGLITAADSFTVSVPTANPLKDELLFAGTKSGRDFNKFEGHGLTAVPAQEVEAPIVSECGIHFECKIRLIQDMTPERMDPAISGGIYKTGDFHTMVFGEIIRCYTTDAE